MKKTAIILLLISLLFSLTACQQGITIKVDANTIASLPEVNRTDAASVATAFIKYGILGNLYDLQYDLSVYGTPDNWFTFYKIDSGYEENEPMNFGGEYFQLSR